MNDSMINKALLVSCQWLLMVCGNQIGNATTVKLLLMLRQVMVLTQNITTSLN